MSDQDTFAGFVRRIRAGDQQAAVEMVRRYEPLIRLEIRLHLEDRRLCRLFDSMDVCQSVLKSFFVRDRSRAVRPGRAGAAAAAAGDDGAQQAGVPCCGSMGRTLWCCCLISSGPSLQRP
jgi:hypothetical protein